jgi:uncharacterized lipoprotein YddW (UPF0748 family)
VRNPRWRGVPLVGLILITVGAVILGGAPAAVEAEGAAEVRALWVDAFHDGIKSPAQVRKLVAEARRANVNTLLVQVRRRGDLYYPGGPEPLAADQPPGYDALRTLLEAAHNGSPRLEVHAWFATYPIWGSRDTPPSDPNHPLNRHGPAAMGDENWLMVRDDGESWTNYGYWLDPGHPAVTNHIVQLATDLVNRYDVDGVHLDIVRYFEGARDRRWGYNAASVNRFNGEYGRSGQPDPNDPLWVQFRRDRVTDLVRGVRESALAVRPAVKISAAVIGSWGGGPRSDSDWSKTSAYSYLFQDWRSWLEQGLLDQAYVMSYFREFEPTQAAWLDEWLAWSRSRGYGRQVVAGLGVYLNSPADSIRQVRRALAPAADGARLAGVALFSYAVPDSSRNNADPADNSPDGFMWDVLTTPLAENDFNPPFAEPVAVPAMPWRSP